jgi:hypothetical protein
MGTSARALAAPHPPGTTTHGPAAARLLGLVQARAVHLDRLVEDAPQRLLDIVGGRVGGVDKQQVLVGVAHAQAQRARNVVVRRLLPAGMAASSRKGKGGPTCKGKSGLSPPALQSMAPNRSLSKRAGQG